MLLNAQPRGFRSNRCPVCSLPTAHCICSHLQPAPCGVRVVLLRHPKEAWRSSGTGFLALRGLQHAELCEPEQISQRFTEGFPAHCALLFPGDGEEAMPTEAIPSQPGQVQTLLVPDGSWQEVRRMVRKRIDLLRLPRVSPVLQGRWIADPLRQDKWTRPCTAEAIGQWLANVGEWQASEQMQKSLRAFVAAHWTARGRAKHCGDL